jgi:hypothetical protein
VEQTLFDFSDMRVWFLIDMSIIFVGIFAMLGSLFAVTYCVKAMRSTSMLLSAQNVEMEWEDIDYSYRQDGKLIREVARELDGIEHFAPGSAAPMADRLREIADRLDEDDAFSRAQTNDS